MMDASVGYDGRAEGANSQTRLQKANGESPAPGATRGAHKICAGAMNLPCSTATVNYIPHDG